METGKRIAILVPCYNEAVTIAKVVADFKKELPDSRVYVYDNNSSDGTAKVALAAGANVRTETRQGKGNVVRTMFREVDADVYVMVDGDDTYPARHVHSLIAPILSNSADMVVGTRLSRFQDRSFRKFHLFGNGLVVGLINVLFRSEISDALSGYRAFSRLFVKSMPVVSKGFEIETEMTTHALDKGFVVLEVPIEYGERPAGSVSKLNTFKDGVLIVNTILRIFKDYRPMLFFSVVSGLFLISGLAVGLPLVFEFFRTGLVPRFPTAILASALVILSGVMFSLGLTLDTIVRHHRENYELWVKNFHE